MAYSEMRFVPDGEGGLRERSDTGWFVGTIVALALLAIGYLAFSVNATPTPLTSAFVKVDVKDGHGSATHIGDGLYVTAAHVVGDNAEVDLNGVRSAVLWSNASYDIALVAGPEQASSVPLVCYDAEVGEEGLAHGNPMAFDDITTTLTVAGAPREMGHWKVALPMDGAVGPGMSGGSWVVGGMLAGVTVGAAMAPAAGGFPSYFGLSIVVPSSVVCDLMGRT